MRRSTFATLLAALLLMTMGVFSGTAAPVNNPHALQFTATCDGVENEFIEPPSNVVAFLVDGTERGIIHHAEFEVSILVDSVEVLIDIVSETIGADTDQKKGLKDRLIECTFEIELPVEFFTDEEWAEIEAAIGIGPGAAAGVIVRGSAQVMPTPAGPPGS